MGASTIGGEFEIEYSTLQSSSDFQFEGYMYSSGRSALYNILLYAKSRLSIKRILIPDYLCSSIYEVLQALDISFSIYNLTYSLKIDYDSIRNIYNDSDIVLLINYFGAADIATQIKNIRSIDPNMLVILDNVQSYYDMFSEYDADFVFTSFRKTLPVPDGGWVKTKYQDLPIYNVLNHFSQYKLAGALLKDVRSETGIDDSIYLDLFVKGEELLDKDYCTTINPRSLSILSNLPIADYASRRRKNAAYLKMQLSMLDIESVIDIPDNVTPLFYPIRLKNRDIIRRELFKASIFCPIHWPLIPEVSMDRALELSTSELSLVIDQRYGLAEMDRIVNIISMNI